MDALAHCYVVKEGMDFRLSDVIEAIRKGYFS
jgi:hypothetical protein